MSLAHYDADDGAGWSMYRPDFAARARKRRAEEQQRLRAIEITEARKRRAEEQQRLRAIEIMEARKRRQKAEFERQLADAEAKKKRAAEEAEKKRAAEIAKQDRIRRELEGKEALPTCASIMAEVSLLTGFTIAELRSKQRIAPLTLARQFAYWRCKKETGQSLPEIGRQFKDATGKRDHTTILHGVRKIDRLIAEGHPQVLAWIKGAAL